MGVHTAAGGRSRPHRHAVAPVAPARAAKPRTFAVRLWCHRGDFGRRRGGEVHGPSTVPPRPTATRAGRSSRHGHTSRRAPRHGRAVVRSARVGGGGPVTPCQRVVAAPNGRVAVTLALLLGSEPNQGWCAVWRGHADDAAAWFVSFGRVWRARGAGACGRAGGSEPPCSLLPKMAASRGEGVLHKVRARPSPRIPKAPPAIPAAPSSEHDRGDTPPEVLLGPPEGGAAAR